MSPKSGWRGLLAVVVAAILGLIAYEELGEPAKIRAAKRAINMAIDACRDGYAPEYYHRLTEAHDAIDQVGGILGPDAEEQVMLETGLSNEQIANSCKQ